MKEKPIIFSADSIRGILAGRKTQTRRVIKPQPSAAVCGARADDEKTLEALARMMDAVYRQEAPKACPYGQPGDRLWIKETFASFSQRHLRNHEVFYPVHKHLAHYPDVIVIYKADGSDFPKHFYDDKMARWTAPIYMHRWESRLVLEIVRVRVACLLDITEDDAMAEGIIRNGYRAYFDPGDNPSHNEYFQFTAREAYHRAWDRINAKRGFPWESNPWVWIIDFKVLERGGE